MGEISVDLEATQENLRVVKEEYATLKELHERGIKKEAEMGELIISMEGTAKDSVEAVEQLLGEVRAKANTVGRMETDLAKLRNHMGTAQFDEILKGKD